MLRVLEGILTFEGWDLGAEMNLMVKVMGREMRRGGGGISGMGLLD